MTQLCAFAGAGFLLAVMGCVVSVPLGWCLVLVAAEKVDLLDTHAATAEQLKVLPGIGEVNRETIIQGRPYQRKEEPAQKKILPRAAYRIRGGSSMSLWRSKSSLVCEEGR